MKRKEIERLVREYLLPQLPNWDVNRAIMFVKPISQCLCAVGFGTSSFDAGLVYTNAFVRPLYLPPVRDKFKRIRQIKRTGGLRLTGTEEEMRRLLHAIREQAMPFFETSDTPEKIAAALRDVPPVQSAYELEAIALSCVLLNDKEGARQAFGRAVTALVEDGRAWCLEMVERLRTMHGKMESDFEAFSAELPKWRQENLQALGLTKFQN